MKLFKKKCLSTAIGISSALVSADPLFASSHREAPAISRDAEADVTDLYAFKSPEDANMVTMIMNVSPAYNAFAGPNWYGFGDDVLYEMHIDNSGDGLEDVTYQFRFKTADYRRDANGLIVANFPEIKYDKVSGRFTGSLNQTYSVIRLTNGRRKGAKKPIAVGLAVAPPRIGPATTDGGLANAGDEAAMYQAYKTLSDNAIRSVDGRKFFAGPRNDPFFVDLGGVFDRVSVRIPGITGTPKDSLAGTNVLTIAVQVPRSDLVAPGGSHFGVWATTSRPRVLVRRSNGLESKIGGAWVQVSRLGNPLVNEVIVKMQDKDRFNSTSPRFDDVFFNSVNKKPALNKQYFDSPQLAFVLNLLYGPKNDLSTAGDLITKIDETIRKDIAAAFTGGVAGINRHPKTRANLNTGDMLRLNLDLNAKLYPQEWPFSGRQLNDDVVKASLVFLAQCNKFTGNSKVKVEGKEELEYITNPFGKVSPPTTGVTPANCLLDDFVTADDKTPGGQGHLATFPYVDLPFSAYGKKN